MTLGRWLAVATAIVSALGLAVELGRGAVPEPIVEHLSLSYEGNVPTWFSSSLLLAGAILAGRIARRAARGRRRWWGIAIGLGYVSLDEASELHEHLGGLIGTHGVLYFDWVIFAAAVLVVLVALYLPFVRALPPPARGALIAAAAIYVAGAVGMELPLGWWAERHGTEDLTYALIDWGEETLEMIGAACAVVALARHGAEPPA